MKRVLNILLAFAVLTIGNMFWPEVVETSIPTSILVSVICTIAGGLILTGLILLVIASVAYSRTLKSIILGYIVLFFSNVIVSGTCLGICTLIFKDFAIHNIWALILMAICMNFINMTANVNVKTNNTQSTSRYRY